ncbi:MAG: hypothetical protein KTR17_01635 [Cellvibrionaceae bacterium]|nr:hypothetical protein [Cellvibrionaceae bacterium]
MSMNYKAFADLNSDIREDFQKISTLDVDLVVGLPRSGMVPAYIVSMLMNLSCTDFQSFLDNRPLKRGSTRSARNQLVYPHDAKKILIVDDSVNTGLSMEQARGQIPEQLLPKVKTMAVYSASRTPQCIDFYLKYLPQPRVFEWNVFGHHVLKEACFDIDGVLCVDPTAEQNDDGEKYRDFILNAEPKFLPSSKVHALVTSRLEKYRPETELWMQKHGVEYEHLIMLDLPSAQERRRLKCHGKHKANYYKNSGALLFVESEVFQAQEICVLTGKPVYCADDNKMYRPGLVKIAAHNPSYFKHRSIELWDDSVNSLKQFVKGLIGYRTS